MCTFAALSLVCCSNPTNQALRWKSNIELPLSNHAFIVGDEFKNLFSSVNDLKDFKMLGIGDTSIDGSYDTATHILAFSKLTKDTFSFEQKQDTMKEKTYENIIGPIPLSTAGDITKLVTFGYSGTLTTNRPVNFIDTVKLSRVHNILFVNSTAYAQLPVTIKNTTSANVDSLVVTLTNVLPSAPSIQVGTLAPGTSQTIFFNVAGNSIDSTAKIRIKANLRSGGTIAAGTGLSVQMSLNGLKAQSVTVIDSLLALSDTMTNSFVLTDSVNIDYTDVKYGFFRYIMSNQTGVPLYISAIHQDLWITPACVNKNVKKVADLGALANISDSLNYFTGDIMNGYRDIAPHSTVEFAKLNLSGNRLFPQWDSANGGSSVTKVSYFVQIRPQGDWVTVNAMDSIIFIIRPSAITFQEMAGTLTKTYEKSSDTQTVEIPFPWPAGDKDSIRSRLVLDKVVGNMHVNTQMPDSAYIDSLLINFKVLSPAFAADSVDTTMDLNNIKNDTTYIRDMNITKVVNNFPDSVKILTYITIPVGTKIRAVNGSPSDISTGTMMVNAYTDYNLKAYFSWRVNSNATMDLGSDTFEIDSSSVRVLQKMSQRSVTVNVALTNNTNINVSIYALLAPDSLRTRLMDTLTTNDVNYLIATPGLAALNGYVNLLDTSGVFVPKRGDISNMSIKLNDSQIDKLLKTKNGAMRWLVRFYPTSASDSLTNKDNIYIKSSVHVEGVNNMDSVFTSF